MLGLRKSGVPNVPLDAYEAHNGESSVHGHVLKAISACEEHERQMEKLMTQITKSAKSNYQFKSTANGLLVIIGTVLIASPILFTWLISTGIVTDKGNLMDLTNLNYFLGGLGIAAFVSTFYIKPQQQMTVAIGDLAQLFLICMMYRLQFHTIVGRLAEETENRNENCNVQAVQSLIQELFEITSKSVQLIDKYLEKNVRTSSSKENKKEKSIMSENVGGVNSKEIKN